MLLTFAATAGPVIQYGSYRICLLAMGGAFIIQFIMTLFFMPESAYHRSVALNIDTGDKADIVEKEETINTEHNEEQRSQSSEQEPQKTWVRELLPYDGYWHHIPFWKTLIRPFFMITSPIVLWATILFTTCISWLVLISISLSQIFSAPPYNFSVSAVGATNVSSLIATFIATVIAGPIIDGLVKVMSRMNDGIFGE